jgi:putative salt-induced outer membrane protein
MLARTIGVACAIAATLGATCARADTTNPITAWALATLADASGAGGATKPAQKLGWAAEGQLGVVLARGNSDTTTANAKLEVVHTTKATKDDFEIDGLYGRTGGIVTAERWATNLQRDWNIGVRTFWFADLRYEHDLFSGFAYQASAATGLGYKLIDSSATKLQVQAGAGYRRLRPEQLTYGPLGEVIARTEGPTQGELVGNGKLNFEHSFNSQTKLTDALMTVVGSANTYLENDLALNVKLNGSFSLSVGYTVRNNSNPPPGLVHTDKLTTVNLIYQRK